MNKRFLTTMMVACALLVSSQAMFAREAPPSKSAPAQKAAPPAQKAAPAPAKAAPAAPPTAKTAPASKPTLEAGTAARGAPPPLAKTTVPDSSGKVTSPPSSGAPAAQGKPSFDNAAAQAQKAQDQQATMKKAETERLAAAQAKRESDAAIARAQASARSATPPVAATAPRPQSADDAVRIRRLEESNRALRANNERYERRARADAREAALRAQYRDSYRFRSPYADIFAGAAIWSVWSSLSTHEQARWMYNHQYQMDSSRYQELLFSNAELRREVQSLERQQLARDSSYVPPQLAGNEDLMYAQNATQIAQQQAAEAQAELAAAQSATTNVPVTQTPVAPVPPAASSGSHWIIWTTLLLVLIGGAAFVWLRREAK